METGAPLASVRDRVASANAYIGARPIVEALRTGLGSPESKLVTMYVMRNCLVVGQFEIEQLDGHLRPFPLRRRDDADSPH